MASNSLPVRLRDVPKAKMTLFSPWGVSKLPLVNDLERLEWNMILWYPHK